MERKDFLMTTTLASLGMAAGALPLSASIPSPSGAHDQATVRPTPERTRKILISGGGFGEAFVRYMASLTGKERPRLCFLPTAAADREERMVRWFRSCAPLNVVPFAQESFISSYSMTESWEEVFLSMDGIVVSGGNTLNQQAIWRAQGIDQVLREAWDRGIVLGGSSAGSLCWFEEGTTDSRPREVSKIDCLGLLKGSHSPHYDSEEVRRPTYHRMIRSGELKPGYACDNDAGIYFRDNEVKRVVATRPEAKCYHVSLVDGEVVERVLEPEMIG